MKYDIKSNTKMFSVGSRHVSKFFWVLFIILVAIAFLPEDTFGGYRSGVIMMINVRLFCSFIGMIIRDVIYETLEDCTIHNSFDIHELPEHKKVELDFVLSAPKKSCDVCQREGSLSACCTETYTSENKHNRCDGCGQFCRIEECDICEGEGLVPTTFKEQSSCTKVDGETSDGYHTFNELYQHRTALLKAYLKHAPIAKLRSKLHDDGTMYDGYFIVQFYPEGKQCSYHVDMKYWNDFCMCKTVEKADKRTGHTAADVVNLLLEE